MNYFGQVAFEMLENNKIASGKAILKTQKWRVCPHFLKFLNGENQPCKIIF